MSKKQQKIPSVADRPYIVRRPYGDDDYRASFKSAQDRLLSDLDNFKAAFLALGAQDSLQAISAIEDKVKKLPDNGGKIDEVFDPYSGLRYRAEIIQRAELKVEL